MEELNNKLNSGTPHLISQIVSKLVKTVKEKNGDMLETPEFKFLKEKCTSLNSSVNIVAAEGILSIIRDGNRHLAKSVITDLITVLTTTRCSVQLVYLMNNLLLVDLEHEPGSYYNLCLPQHPFIVMLNEDVDCWSTIFQEIATTYSTSLLPCKNLYKPIFLYTLCDPTRFIALKLKLWTFVLETKDRDLILSLISWMQFENRDTIQLNSSFLIELAYCNSETLIIDPNVLILLEISALYQLVLHGFDPRQLIICISYLVEETDPDVDKLNPGLCLIAKCIPLCPASYLMVLLELCKLVVSKAKCDSITCNILKAALLQWISNPSDLVSDGVKLAKEIFSSLESNSLSGGFGDFLSRNYEILSTNSDIYLTVQMFSILETFKTETDLNKWIEKLDQAPAFFSVKLMDFLVGILLSNSEDTKVFDLILKCVEYDHSLAPNILTVVLYKLTSATDPNLHYKLLKSVPKMSVSKHNFRKIVSTIQILNKGKNTLRTFSATLMLDLWKMNNKAYTYLEEFLIAPLASPKFEFYVTRSSIIKALCSEKPELYGKEMVAHISKILNECNSSDGALATAFAIDAITALCKSEIIDAVSMWATLAPMFQTEARIPVIKSFCALVAEIPALSYVDSNPKLVEDVVGKLWDFLVVYYDDEIWVAALDALTHFTVEQIVAFAPDKFFDEEILSVRKSGAVVPGYCWIQFMKNCSASKLSIAGDFLIKLISLEVSNYLKYVYQVKGTREPVDYSYLPVNSVVRGISTYIKSHIIKWKSDIYKEVYLQCLRIFSEKFSKPLPPLDWCFLQELFHEPQSKEFCVKIAANQVVLSGTARRFMVNYIEAVTQNPTFDDVLLIYRTLEYFANSIQPFILKPFLEVTIKKSIELFKEDEKQLIDILKELRKTLSNVDIQDTNKFVISQIITDWFVQEKMSSKLFDILLECVLLFPSKSIEELSSPKSVQKLTEEWFERATKIRCSLALHGNSANLNLLNGLIEHGGVFPKLFPFMFEQFALVFRKNANSTESVLWLLELIGQIQATTAEKTQEKEICFLCDVFMVACCIFSGFDSFVDCCDLTKIYRLFPRAVATLFDVNHWSICTAQALEWFHHITKEKIFKSDEYKQIFVLSLQALRHEKEFSKNMKWVKYLNLAC